MSVPASLLRVRIAAIRAALARGDIAGAMLELEQLERDVEADDSKPLILWASA